MFLTDFIKRIFSKKKSINNLRQNLNSYTDMTEIIIDFLN